MKIMRCLLVDEVIATIWKFEKTTEEDKKITKEDLNQLEEEIRETYDNQWIKIVSFVKGVWWKKL